MEGNKWTTLKDELTQKYIELHVKSNNITNNMLTDEIANILVGKRVVSSNYNAWTNSTEHTSFKIY